jgi:predicted dehydrogenase
VVLKTGFIGTGGIATAHLRACAGFPDVAITALCDIDAARVAGQSEEFGGRAYTDFAQMLEREELDALYICIPPFAHGEIELAAAEKGISMFIEKPVALEVDMAHRIRKAIEESGVIVSVGYHWRYSASVARARHVLRDRTVTGCLGAWIGGLPGVPWWSVEGRSGGQHVEQTTHVIDTCRYLLGSEAVSVHGACTRKPLPERPEFDIAEMSNFSILFANGQNANITSNCTTFGFRRVGVEVFCRGAMISVNRQKCIVRENGEESASLDGFAGADRDRVFVDAVKSGDRSAIKSNYADAVKTLEVSLAATRAFASGEVEKV